MCARFGLQTVADGLNHSELVNLIMVVLRLRNKE